MAVSLSASLTAHQKKGARSPQVQATIAPTRLGFPILSWTRFYTGAEADSPHAATIAADGSLIRARNDSGTLYTSRVASPGSGSTYSTWNNTSTCFSGAGLALAAKTGELTLAYVAAGGLNLDVRHSTDNGATWSAATTRATEASAIGSVAVAYNAAGNLCVFYTLGTSTTLKRLRRTSGTWDGSGTAWTRAADWATITGVAAAWSSDFQLLITGTQVTTAHPRAYAYRMGDTLLPINAWSSPVTVAEADAASTTTFAGPAASLITGNLLLAGHAHKEAGNVPVNRAHLEHPPAALSHFGTNFTEPTPHEAQSAYGIALCSSLAGDSAWITTPAGVWYAASSQTTVSLTTRVEALTLSVTPDRVRAALTLDNHDGALTAAAYPSLAPGRDLNLRPGYLSGTAGAFETGATYTLTIARVERARSGNAATVTVHATGAPEALRAFHAPQAWQVATGALTRGAIYTRIAAKAGILCLSTGADAAWSAYSPAFVLAAGESAQSALERLLPPVPDSVRPAGPSLTIVATTPTDATNWSIGASGEHPISTLEISAEPPPANWTRAQGDARADDAHTWASLYARGPRLDHLRDLDATTNAKVTATATNALRRHTLADPQGALTVPYHAGIELHDVVALTDPLLALSAQKFRVLALELRYSRQPKAPRFDTLATLGAL